MNQESLIPQSPGILRMSVDATSISAQDYYTLFMVEEAH
jgi:hypothetical protein